MTAVSRVAVTAGEPGGIGPDLMATLASRPSAARCVVFADPELLQQRAATLGCPLRVAAYDPQRLPSLGTLEVQAIPMPAPARAGIADSHFASYVLRCINEAGAACLEGRFDALVTGPVQKRSLLEAGLPFSGHTEYLARQAESFSVMMLTASTLRVALATTHLPLAQVPGAVTRERLAWTLETLIAGLRDRFDLDAPVIRVLGLNPHAGEGGHLGEEEQSIIAPVVEALRRDGHAIEGPVSADTAFVEREGVDAFLAMYHDQGLPVLKTLGFGHAVNVTLGLPYVRTSVDHGTALDLAGTGRADPGSLFAAVDSAVQQVENERVCLAAA